MSNSRKRIENDVKNLIKNGFKVELENNNVTKFHVDFYGPKESCYENGCWKVFCQLQDSYPFKSPSIGFLNKIYHPNIDEASGTVCLDVINQTWSPMFDLINIFEVFLPQLLLYPNPKDPLNGEAASLYLKDRKAYEEKVIEYIKKYAIEFKLKTDQIPTEESEEGLIQLSDKLFHEH